MTLPALPEDHLNCKFTYKVRVPQKLATVAPQFIRDLQALIAQCPKQNWTGQEAVLAVRNFGEHLYQPLVLDAGINPRTPHAAEKQQLAITPPPLAASEQDFVEMLRDYWLANAATVHAGESMYLLRNLSRGKGVGFFESEGFFPDFILWHRTVDGRQRLVFIEPHGMRRTLRRTSTTRSSLRCKSRSTLTSCSKLPVARFTKLRLTSFRPRPLRNCGGGMAPTGPSSATQTITFCFPRKCGISSACRTSVIRKCGVSRLSHRLFCHR